MTFGDIFRIIIALFIPPLGVFTQVGLGRAFWINLLIYLFAVGGFGFPCVVRDVASSCDSRFVYYSDA
jgi:uncharacterized membrane protein YqaE (UPF0057 family)